jgi:MFS family permease
VGTAAVAPFILVAFGVKALFFVCAAFLAVAAVRIFALPLQKDVTVREALRRLDLSELEIGFRPALRWLLGWPAIVTIIMVGMVVTVLSNIEQTLGPSYVAEVLETEPSRAVYVFAPAGLGALVALAITPRLVDKMGERWAAAVAVLIMSLSLFTMAFIEQLAPILGPVSPMNALRLVGLQPSDRLLAASFISMFTGFAVSMSSVSVQTYVNRRVPMMHQGRVFGLQSVLANAAALIPMVLIGVLVDLTSIRTVLFFAPWVVLIGVYRLLFFTSRWVGEEPMSRGQVLDSFWREPEHDDALAKRDALAEPDTAGAGATT